MAFNRHGTLTANVVTTVTVAKAVSTIEVVNVNGAGSIYFTVNGTNPTVGGDDCEIVAAGTGAAFLVDAPNNPVSVKLISAEATEYTVRAA